MADATATRRPALVEFAVSTCCPVTARPVIAGAGTRRQGRGRSRARARL